MVLLGSVPVQLCLSPCLLTIALQEGVLVAVQVVHQVPIAAVLGDDIDGSWWETAPTSALPWPCSLSIIPKEHCQVAGCPSRARRESHLYSTEHFGNLKSVFAVGSEG